MTTKNDIDAKIQEAVEKALAEKNPPLLVKRCWTCMKYNLRVDKRVKVDSTIRCSDCARNAMVFDPSYSLCRFVEYAGKGSTSFLPGVANAVCAELKCSFDELFDGTMTDEQVFSAWDKVVGHGRRSQTVAEANAAEAVRLDHLRREERRKLLANKDAYSKQVAELSSRLAAVEERLAELDEDSA